MAWFLDDQTGRNSEQIERRTSNVQHRMSNIDYATLYLFKNKQITEYWTAACDEPIGRELWSNDSAESNFEG